MPQRMMKPHFEFAAFESVERLDDEKREVTAYAFVNPKVGDGVDLSRASMEDATADYMTFANIREMHQPSAVGKCLRAEWDKKGCRFTMKIVDDTAWQKVKERVYTGLSVGVLPLVMRGDQVVKCEWFETSLCDRPKDRDALITSFRNQQIDPTKEYPIKVKLTKEEKIARDAGQNRKEPTTMPDAITRSAEDTALITRLEGERDTLKTERDTSKTEAATLRAQVATVTGEKDSLTAEKAKLEKKLVKRTAKLEQMQTELTRLQGTSGVVPPVRFPNTQRTLLQPSNPFGGGEDPQGKALLEQRTKLIEGVKPETAPDDRIAIASQINAIDSQLAELGLSAE